LVSNSEQNATRRWLLCRQREGRNCVTIPMGLDHPRVNATKRHELWRMARKLKCISFQLVPYGLVSIPCK
jgi:hypothetical protein